jgi:glycosyltransferase involved in cell wall biosynthesis
MKIVHVCTYAQTGGAARAVYRLNEALRLAGADSSILTMNDAAADDGIVAARPQGIDRVLWSRLRAKKDNWAVEAIRKGSLTPFCLGTTGIDISKHPLIQSADIVNLHWVCAGFLSVKTLAALLEAGRRIVWTFHDMWPFTGGCHYAQGCVRFTKECGNCPQLGSSNPDDRTSVSLRQKQKVLSKTMFSCSAVSEWLAGLARQSAIFRRASVCVLPNTFNADTFHLSIRGHARETLGIGKERIVCAFGGGVPGPSVRKGGPELLEALRILVRDNRDLAKRVLLFVFGKNAGSDLRDEPFEISIFGPVDKDSTLADIYNAADVVAAPSIEEAFGQVPLESLACGTPVVAFSGTGVADIVEHCVTGYLAKYRDCNDLARGILWCIENNTEGMRATAHKVACDRFSYQAISRRYLGWYETVVRQGSNDYTRASV